MKLLGSSFFTTADELLGPNPEELSAELRASDDARALRTCVEVPAEGYPRTKVPECGGRLARSGW